MDRKPFFALLLLLLMFTGAIQAQNQQAGQPTADDHTTLIDPDVDKYTEQLNDLCPFHKDDWVVKSVTMVGDRYALLDLQAPSSLSMVFPTVTENKDNVKKMWIRQLKQYGDKWNQYIKLLTLADRPLVLILTAEGGPKSAILTIQPSNFN